MNTPGLPESAPKSVVIVRLSALGDVINVVPVVRAIQDHWPETKISWVIGRNEAGLVRGLDNVEFVVVDKSRGLGAFRDVRRRLAGRKQDVLLHAQVSARANLVALGIPARRRIGYDRVRAREGHGLVVRERIPGVAFQHQVQGFLEFARTLGLPAREPRWDLPLDPDDLAFAREILPDPGQRLLISPCSSHPARNWSAQGYARVADRGFELGAGPAVIMGGPGRQDQAMAREIESRVRHPVINLVGRDTLTRALAVIDRGRVLVAPDSGPVHFAAAMGTPVLGLYAATWSRRSGPWGSLENCVDRFADAARRFRHREPEELRWGTRIEKPGVMDLIDTASVLERLEPLLD